MASKLLTPSKARTGASEVPSTGPSPPSPMRPRADRREQTPLVMLPGTLCDRRVFGPLIARLGRRAMSVAELSGAATTAGLAAQVLADAPPRFALLGFSLGGIVALEIAAQAPERIAGLALVASNARPVQAEDRPVRRAALDLARRQGLRPYVEQVLWPSYVAARSAQNAQIRALVVDMAQGLGLDVLGAQVEAALMRADSRPRLAALQMPVLLICGEEDETCTVEMHREMARAIPGAAFTVLPDAGHFALLEAPDRVAAEVSAWLDRIDAKMSSPRCGAPPPQPRWKVKMTEDAKKSGPSAASSHETAAIATAEQGRVLQVERRDFVDLVPNDRPRVQSLRGFDDCYTDIVDYIVRCTHKIWDERDVGLIYSHYTHNCVLYGTLGTMYERESVVRETIQRLVELPDRRGMATQVLWRGDDVEGFYTSHMTHGTGRHTEYGMYGKPTGRTFVTRTVADCMILENKIYREWVVRDNLGLLVQLGIDPHVYAANIAQQKFDRGETTIEIAENRRLLGQYPPESEADVSIAHSEDEAEVLRWLHHIYNKRMFGKIAEIYAPTVQWHGPMLRELYGVAAVLQQTMRLVALIPDCAFVPQHICSNPSEEGGYKVAVRWMMDGHHLGYGTLGAPTGHRLSIMGMTHYHIKDGKIIDEWVVYDELSMLVQLKLGQLTMAA